MADTNSALLNLLLMETNSHNNDWGTQLNADFNIVDRAGGLKTAQVVTTGGVSTRSQDQLVEPIQRVTGVLASNATIEVPGILDRANFWINDTTGNFTLTIRVAGQTGINVVRGDTKLLRCNGTDVVDVGIPTYSHIAGIAEWLGSAGGQNAYTVSANQFISGLSDGLGISCFIPNANNSTAVTLNFNSTGAKPVVHSDGSALGINDIPANSVKSFTYHLSTDKWYMAEVSASTLTKSTNNNTWSGDNTFTGNVIEPPSILVDAAPIAWDMLATSRNVQVTLAASRAMGTPTNQVVGQSGRIEFIQPAGGLCNVTFPAEFDPMTPVAPAVGPIPPRIDLTPSARTVFGYNVVAINAIQLWPLYMSGRNSIGYYREFDLGSFVASQKTQAHGLGGYPALMQAYVECTAPNQGYAVGDRLLIGDLKDADNERGFNVGMNATNVFVKIGANNPILITSGGSSGNGVEMTKTSWKLIARVYE